MQQFLKKFEKSTKCSDKECKTMITEANNDKLLCGPCFEIFKRDFRLLLLAKFGFQSQHLSPDGFGDAPRPPSRGPLDYGDYGF